MSSPRSDWPSEEMLHATEIYTSFVRAVSLNRGSNPRLSDVGLTSLIDNLERYKWYVDEELEPVVEAFISLQKKILKDQTG